MTSETQAGHSFNDCFIKPRPDGPPIYDGRHIRLDGYAIVPIEEYEALAATPPVQGEAATGWQREICTGCSASISMDEQPVHGIVSCCPDRRMVTVEALVNAYEAPPPVLTGEGVTCFECDTDLVGPFCPACNPRIAAALSPPAPGVSPMVDDLAGGEG